MSTSEFSLPIKTIEGGGYTAWLAEDHSVPVVSIAWSWPGGAALDPDGQEGVATLAADLLTEGAGDLDATAFADALDDQGINLDFGVGRDEMTGGLRALPDALGEAVRLANLAMTAPRLSDEAIDRRKAAAIARARATRQTPRGIADLAFRGASFPKHPAGRTVSGSPESLADLDKGKFKAALDRQIRKGGLLIAACGAITGEQLANILPQLFQGLPDGEAPKVPALPVPASFGVKVEKIASPQSTILFGQPGMAVTDPDWEAAQVVLRVLAGGGFGSRLMEAVREKRGLAYGIGAGFDSFAGQAVIVGATATVNARVQETLSVLRDEWGRMASEGPTEAEVTEAVAYLTGSMPLQFTDSRRIAATLLAMRRNGRPIDWLNQRGERLAAVTRERAVTVSSRLLDASKLSVVIAGEPEGF
ncbi:insulinase family protein [Acetobacteraceae bacterium H6797]|nr:insulinase family protein [Acetobacteraceae bacterium H6797]